MQDRINTCRQVELSPEKSYIIFYDIRCVELEVICGYYVSIICSISIVETVREGSSLILYSLYTLKLPLHTRLYCNTVN